MTPTTSKGPGQRESPMIINVTPNARPSAPGGFQGRGGAKPRRSGDSARRSESARVSQAERALNDKRADSKVRLRDKQFGWQSTSKTVVKVAVGVAIAAGVVLALCAPAAAVVETVLAAIAASLLLGFVVVLGGFIVALGVNTSRAAMYAPKGD